MMKDKNTLAIILLLILTISTALVSNFASKLSWIAFPIMALSGLKFILVSFQFMELKKAHNTWKVLVSGFLVLIVVTVSLILT